MCARGFGGGDVWQLEPAEPFQSVPDKGLLRTFVEVRSSREDHPGIIEILNQRVVGHGLAGCRVVVPDGVVPDAIEAGRRRRFVAVTPPPRARIEPVFGQQPGTGRGDQMHGLDDEVDGRIGHVVGETHPDPARLDAEPAIDGLGGEVASPVVVDAEKPMSVWSGTGTTAATLDAEQVAEHGYDETVVQVPATLRTDEEGNDRQPVRGEVAEDLDGRVGTPRPDHSLHSRDLQLLRRDKHASTPKCSWAMDNRVHASCPLGGESASRAVRSQATRVSRSSAWLDSDGPARVRVTKA